MIRRLILYVLCLAAVLSCVGCAGSDLALMLSAPGYEPDSGAPERAALTPHDTGIVILPPVSPDPESFDHTAEVFPYDRPLTLHSEYTVPSSQTDELIDIVRDYYFETGCYVIDLGSGMTFGYNADEIFETASTIKAGYVLYCCYMLSQGEGSLDEQIMYETKDYHDGSGSIKWDFNYGTMFTVRDLIHRTLDESDNVAYYMLQKRFGFEGYNEYMAKLGVPAELAIDNRWGDITPRQLGLIWKEIYDRREDNEFYALLWEEVTHNQLNEIAKELEEYDVIAHKSGWSHGGYHDSGIVFSDHPYIIVVMTGTGSRNRCLYRVVRCLDDIMKSYGEWFDGEFTTEGYLAKMQAAASTSAAETESEYVIPEDTYVPPQNHGFVPQADESQESGEAADTAQQ